MTQRKLAVFTTVLLALTCVLEIVNGCLQTESLMIRILDWIAAALFGIVTGMRVYQMKKGEMA